MNYILDNKHTIINKSNFYAITGSPSSGKTTLIKALKEKGYITVPEIARRIIQEQQKIKGEIVPWKNKNQYKEVMVNESIKSFYDNHKKGFENDPIFFDRGFLDSFCYTELIGSVITNEMNFYGNNLRYNKNVFMLKPWKEIYCNDSQRKQNWEEAVLTYKKLSDIYHRYHYNIIELPNTTVKKRVEFITNFIEK